MPLYLPNHKSRAEAILALVPIHALDSGDESEEEDYRTISEEALNQQIEDFFDVIGGEPLADDEENIGSLLDDVYMEEDGYDSNGPQPELLCTSKTILMKRTFPN
ncbi:hypothetical protein GE061_013830 [Apolygus lucorum]|uniref:Uncharacterized protein n=1 Tax=Apolygus lucorum TaxID=248454 RepID=A0A6A4JME4_APOLU|nr:hypothetical protein GE061_013830 [Apolygus lucorum]